MTTGAVASALIRCTSCKAINKVPVKRLKENPLCGNCKTLLDFPMGPVNATAETFGSEIELWPETVLVEFWAKECSACSAMESVVQDAAFLRAGILKVVKVDVDTEPSLALLYSIRATPTFIIMRNNKQVARLDGAPRDKNELLQWIERNLAA